MVVSETVEEILVEFTINYNTTVAASRAVTVDTKLILNSLILLLVNSMGKLLNR